MNTTSKLKAFTIIWNEGMHDYAGQTFTTWADVQRVFNRLFTDWLTDPLGYTKVKVNVKWENGAEITDRVDVAATGGNYNPQRETVGEYLARHNSVMYASNMQKGDRAGLSFSDQPSDTAPSRPKLAQNWPKTGRKQAKTAPAAPQPPAPLPLPQNPPKTAENQPKTAPRATRYPLPPISTRTFADAVGVQAKIYQFN